MLHSPDLSVAETLPLSDLYEVDALAAAHPQHLTAHLLRYQLRHRDTNGLSMACIRLGKKLLISKTRYEAWLATRAGVQ